jgi:hypothetical protein
MCESDLATEEKTPTTPSPASADVVDSNDSAIATPDASSPPPPDVDNTDYTMLSLKTDDEVNPQSSSPLFRLPAEITKRFLDCFHGSPAKERIFLALSCKKAYLMLENHLSLPREGIECKEDVDFLLGLEENFKNAYYCDDCVKLHPSNLDWALSEWSDIWEPCTVEDTFCPVGWRFCLWFHIVRLVMNSHFHGPGHGLPLEVLSFDRHNWDIEGEFALSALPYHERGPRMPAAFEQYETARGKIIDDKLFVMCKLTVSHIDGDAFALQKMLGKGFSVCKHVGAIRKWWSLERSQERIEDGIVIPEFAERDPSGPPPATESGSCRSCWTDWDIEFEWKGEDIGWVVSITRYHGLGYCRDPTIWMWGAISENETRCHQEHLRQYLGREDPEKYGPGTSKEAWYRESD